MSGDDFIKQWSKEILESQAYRDAVKMRLISGKAPALEKMLFHYAYGKPPESMIVEVGSTLAEVIAFSRDEKLIEAEVNSIKSVPDEDYV